MIGTSALIKLMILFFLDSKDYPIALSSVYGFFLGNYAEYFKLNETINTLITDGLIESEGTLDSTFLKITNTGKDGDYILVSSEDDVYEFLSEDDQVQKTDLQLFDYILKRFNDV